MKMREFMRITLVCVCAFLLAVRETRCEDEVSEMDEGGALRGEDQNEQRKDSKGPIPGNPLHLDVTAWRTLNIAVGRLNAKSQYYDETHPSELLIKSQVKN
ncbi:unnamed protein product [Spodoptera exigua]|nr:unnamed protein product [Spodoptera exigua]